MKKSIENNKGIVRIAFIGLSILYIIFAAAIILSGSFREFIISSVEFCMGRGLDHDYWNAWFLGHRFIFVSCFFLLSVWLLISGHVIFFLKFLGKCFRKVYEEARGSYLFYLLAIGIAFNQFLNGFFASDHIDNYSANNYSFYIPQFGKETVFSRIFAHLITNIDAFLNLFGITMYNAKWLWEVSGMIVFALCAALTEKSLFRVIKKDINIWAIRVCVLICYINPFIVEAYTFTPFDFSMGILCGVLSGCLIVRKKWLLAAVMAFMAEGFYETNICIIIVLCLAYTYLENMDKDYLTLFREEIKGLAAAAAGAGLYMILYKTEIMVFGTIYESKDIHVMSGRKSVLDFFGYFCDLVSGMYAKPHGYMPDYSVAAYLILLFVIVILYLFHNKEYTKIITFFLFFLSSVVSPFTYCVVITYGTFARLLFSYFFAIGLISLVSFLIVSDNKKLRLSTGTVIIIFCSVVFFMTQSFITDSFIGQAISQNIVHMVEDRINKYEEESGLKVDEVAIRGCESIRDVYEEQLVNREFTYAHPVIYDPWAQWGYLNFVRKTDYKCREMQPYEYEKYFHKRDFDSFDLTEQMVFDGSTAYWVVY